MIRIIETANNIAKRQPNISQLPVGVYYNDGIYGLVVDYITEYFPEELLESVIYACLYDGVEYVILKEAASDFEWKHSFNGWPGE